MMLLLVLAARAEAACTAVGDGRYALTGYTTYPSAILADSLAVGDLDGDTRDDVVVGIGDMFETLYVRVYLQQGDGALVAGAVVDLSGGGPDGTLGSVALGDVDGDGDLDVAANSESGVHLLANDGAGHLAPPVALGGSAYRAVRLLDADDDGNLDVLALATYAVHVAWGDGTGAFEAPTELFETDGTPVALAGLAAGGGAGTDLVLAEQSAVGFSLWTDAGRRAFAFADAWDLDEGRNGGGLAVGDLDGDGLTDAVRTGYGNRPVNISVFYQGASGFDGVTTYSSYDVPGAVLVADVDTDSRDDIVVVHEGWGCVGVYLQGPRGLGAEDLYAIPHASGYDPYGVGVGDLDGDDCTDVAIADYESGLVVLPGTGCKDRYKDTDGDAVPDVRDVCFEVYDPAQGDRDEDGIGDVCDGCPTVADDAYDSDGDGIPNACDGCPVTPDDGADADGDGLSDACDPCPDVADDGEDADDDGLPDACDGCPADPDDGADADVDTVPDACDACPGADDRADADGDGVPDACEEADTAAPADTGTPAPPPARPEGGGCGCDNGGAAPAFGWVGLVGLSLLGRRRRMGPLPPARAH